MFFPCYLIFHPLCFAFPLAFVSTRLPRPKTFVSQIACRLFVIAYIGQPFVVGYLLYRHVAFFGGEAQPFSAGAPYAPLGQEGEVVICLPEAVELFVPAVACGRLLRQKIHYMDVGKAMVYAILYQLQFCKFRKNRRTRVLLQRKRRAQVSRLLMESPTGRLSSGHRASCCLRGS